MFERGKDLMAIITISREFGAGGRTFGNMIAEKLGYKFLDDVIIHEIAKEAGVTSKAVKAVERIAGGTLSKLMSKIVSENYIDRIIGADKGYINENIYVDVLTKVMKTLAEQDNVVLMGRGGQYILAEHSNAYHILLVSDMEHRIEFMQRYYKLNSAQAERTIKMGQKRRSLLYTKLGKEDYNSPLNYHLILNMTKLSLEDALRMACALVENS